ncbi:B12-binding domain-containing radical SAM protein [Roseibium sp.]|uniref:B12-binding domain-containing radical SAM protein n=1 Tax=Roseibium sp. TaxID=1936156 RepID=UPI003BB0EEB4
MAKVLLINPNKWGRGITAIWIPAHAALLRSQGHEVELFDATFFTQWTVDEIGYNTENGQYKPAGYKDYIKYNDKPIFEELKAKAGEFKPDIVFWSAISSHIHGEGEYVNIQYGYELAEKLQDTGALLVTGGLQATASPHDVFKRMPNIDVLIRGESEFGLLDIANAVDQKSEIKHIRGLAFKNDDAEVKTTPPQPILQNLDDIPAYDYSIFEPQVFFRAYNGEVLNAADYELSRGCIYACEYCVETVIQEYYGFNETTRSGAIRRAPDYLRSKSPERILEEMRRLREEFGVRLLRCQDTNFLTIKKDTLNGLADLMDKADLDVMLYIETRPEGVTDSSIELLKRLKVDGVGMGVELATQDFREDKLRRFASQEKIIRAFKLLGEAGIKRTSYNIIGLPEQDEESIQATIEFNRLIAPDNTTVAFYSPYQGTAQQQKGNELGYFDEYEFHVDGQLRTVSRDTLVDAETLCFYKARFARLVREGLSNLDQLKEEYFAEQAKQQAQQGLAQAAV